MVLDAVHGIQQAYREVVRAFAGPGTIVSIAEQASQIDLETTLPPPLVLLAMMLLDAETEFAIESGQPDTDAALISQLTYSHRTAHDEAAFLLVTDSGTTAAHAADLVARARVGTLLSPHLGATILLESTSLSPEIRTGETNLVLTGPGIENETLLSVGGPGDWIASRAEANREYPLGVDMVLFTREGSLVALPRTTRVAPEED